MLESSGQAAACLAGQAVVHFRSGIPHSNRTTGQATISCCRIPTSGNPHPVEKSTVSAEVAASARTSYPALVRVPYRYFHMRFHEGRTLEAMLQELKDLR